MKGGRKDGHAGIEAGGVAVVVAVVVAAAEVQQGFGLCPLASWRASSSQCKGLELPLDGIFSPVASAVPASIWRAAACAAESQPLGDTAIKNKPRGQPAPLI